LKVVYERDDPQNNLPVVELSQGATNLWLILLFGILFIMAARYLRSPTKRELAGEGRDLDRLRGGVREPSMTHKESIRSLLAESGYKLSNISTETPRENWNRTFPVEWKGLFKILSIYMTVMAFIPIILTLGIRFFHSGFSFNEAFGKFSPFELFLIFICIVGVLVGIAFLIALWIRFARITISNGEIRGLNLWGFRNRIPLTEVTSLTPMSIHGINAIIVHSSYHGKIGISDRTQDLPELLSILHQHLPESINDPRTYPAG